VIAAAEEAFEFVGARVNPGPLLFLRRAPRPNRAAGVGGRRRRR
jgi:hypothetical protein